MTESSSAPPADVDTYIAGFPPEQREVLEKVRRAIRSRVPSPEEKIRYGMPAIMLGGRYALHFAGWKKHVGLYPVPVLDEALEREVAPYRSGKDSVNFAWSAVPYDLIERVTSSIVAQRGSGGSGR